MWTRITTREQLSNLQRGRIIVRYPVLNFDPVDNFDENDAERISIRFIESNNTGVETMNISLVLNVNIEGDNDGINRFGNIFQSYQDIINSMSYWVNIS